MAGSDRANTPSPENVNGCTSPGGTLLLALSVSGGSASFLCYQQLAVKGKQQKIPKGILTAFVQTLTTYTTGATEFTNNTYSRKIQDAITHQQSSG